MSHNDSKQARFMEFCSPITVKLAEKESNNGPLKCWPEINCICSLVALQVFHFPFLSLVFHLRL